MPDEAKAVAGERLSFWRGTRLTSLVFALAAPVCVAGAVYWAIHLVRGFGHLLDDRQVGPTVVGTAFFAFVFVFGLVVLVDLPAFFRRVVVRGACPRCGAEGQRIFEARQGADAGPTPCGACGAYLCARGNQVREELTAAADTSCLPYELPPQRYLPAAQRDSKGHYQFAWPTTCAVCGASGATHHIRIAARSDGGSRFKLLGGIARVATDLSDTPSPSRHDHVLVRPGRSPGSSDPSKQHDLALDHLEVPVCAEHTEDNLPYGGDALAYDYGSLRFASYGFYRAFLALNQLDGASASPGSPEAVEGP